MYISPYFRSALEPPNFMKFGIRGHLTDVITCGKFLVNRFRGYGVLTSRKWPFPIDLLRRSYNSSHCRATLWFIYLFIFSRTNVEKRPLDGFWRALPQKTRNRAGMCHFGVITWKNWKQTPVFTPQNPKNLAPNGQFPAKMMKHETPSMSESTKPIETNI